MENSSKLRNLLTVDLDNIVNSGHNIITAGSLHAKHQAWNCKTASRIKPYKCEIYTRIDSKVKNLILTHLSPPARYPTHSNQSPEVLDIAIIKAFGLDYHLENLPKHLSFDHSTAVLDIHHHSSHVSRPKPLILTCWQKYETNINSMNIFLPNFPQMAKLNRLKSYLSLILCRKTLRPMV